MAIKGCVERIAQSQLSRKAKLNSFFFDENEVMHENIRKRLLAYAQIYIDNIYEKFENTVIKDICLVGSQASYFYHDQSDIDLVINIQSEDNNYLQPDNFKSLHKYIGAYENDFLPYDKVFHQYSIDIKPFRFQYLYEQQYSLLQNKWINHFDEKFLSKLSPQLIVETYYKKLAEIFSKMQEIYTIADSTLKQKNALLKEYYNYLLFEMRNESYLMNVIYRTLRSQHQIQALGTLSALNDLKRINNLTTGNRYAATETPEDTAQRLLSPQDRLSPLLFDNEAHIHEDLRKKLIDAAKIVFEHTAGKLDGTVIKDICLIGSMVSYSYRADSDIDVAVIVDFDKCPYIDLRNKVRAVDFLTEIYAAAVDVLPQFRIGGKMVDITLKTNISRECYSLLQNKWISKPEHNISEKISAGELVVYFYKELEKYALFMKQFKLINGHYNITDCTKIRNDIIDKMNMHHQNTSENHLVYRMLSQQGLIKLFGSNMNDSLNFALSLTGKPAGT